MCGPLPCLAPLLSFPGEPFWGRAIKGKGAPPAEAIKGEGPIPQALWVRTRVRTLVSLKTRSSDTMQATKKTICSCRDCSREAAGWLHGWDDNREPLCLSHGQEIAGKTAMRFSEGL